MEQDSERQKVDPRAAESEVRQTGLTEVGMPNPPKGMSDAEAQKVQNEATALVQRLSASSGHKEMELLDNLSNMGMQAQKSAAGQLDLLRGRVSTFLADGGPSREIADSMRDLRIAL